MNELILLLDVAPSAGAIGAGVAAVFFFVLLATAFVAYKALKKTAKMAFRMTVVAVILLVAVIGSATLWYFSSGGSPKLKPPAERPARK